MLETLSIHLANGQPFINPDGRFTYEVMDIIGEDFSDESVEFFLPDCFREEQEATLTSHGDCHVEYERVFSFEAANGFRRYFKVTWSQIGKDLDESVDFDWVEVERKEEMVMVITYE